MRLLLAAICCVKGNFEANLTNHLRLLAEAATDGCDLVLFPDMSLTGSVAPIAHPEHLATLDHPAAGRLVQATGDTGIAARFELAEHSGDGQAYIAQLFAVEGRIIGVQHKRHLGEGEESSAAGTDAMILEVAGTKLGQPSVPNLASTALRAAVRADGRVVLFPAAPGLCGRRTDAASWRDGVSWWETCSLGDARRHDARLWIWIALAGQAGSTVDEDFPGLAALVTPNGVVAAGLPGWKEGILTVEIPVGLP